ncbi:MAG: phosphatase PAP2 family protein [Clostridia bacterium]
MKKQISLKTKTIISMILFVVIFAGLLVVATFYDLQISQLLAKPKLADGAYFSTSNFGLLGEVLGSAPIYLTITLAATIWFWYLYRNSKKWLSILLLVVSFIATYLFFADIFNYIGEEMGNEEFMSQTYILLTEIILALMLSLSFLFAWGRINPKTNENLRMLGVVILCALIGQAIVHLVKAPMGRARFRTLNAIDDFSLYTKWFVVNGKRILGTDLADDCCKSFPSGHTCAAGAVYSLLALPYLVKSCSTKKAKLWIWILCIAFVGTVATSRIVVGAHYLSDVLVAGTIAFLSSMIFIEIFVCKGLHFKAIFGKLPADYEEVKPED